MDRENRKEERMFQFDKVKTTSDQQVWFPLGPIRFWYLSEMTSRQE